MFKRRLGALQQQRGSTSWRLLLLELGRTINTTHCRGFPLGATPFQVFFGRSHIWETVAQKVYIPVRDDNELLAFEEPIDSDASDGLSAIFEDLPFPELQQRARDEETARLQADAAQEAEESHSEAEGCEVVPEAFQG